MTFGDITQALMNIAFALFGFNIDISNLGKTAQELCDWDMISTSELGTLASTINTTVTPIALSILAAFLMIDLIKKAMDIDRVSWQHVAMTLLRFLIYKMLIEYSYEFLSMFMEVGQDLFGLITDAISYDETTATNIGQMLGEMIDNAEGGITIPIINWSIMPLILFVVFLIIYLPLIGTFVMAIAQIFSRVVKIVITFAFSPIPLGIAILDDGGGNTGKRLSMSMIATTLEGLIIIVCTHIYSRGIAILMEQTSGDDATFAIGISCMIGVLLLNGILVTALSTTAQISERWLGA